MKPSSHFDFIIHVQRQSLEWSAPMADFLEDAFQASLNFQLRLMFVPKVVRSAGTWPPVQPASVEEVTSADAAYRALLVISRFSVTPDDERTGTAEVSEMPEDDDRRVIFFVSQHAFDAFSHELSPLADGRPDVHEGWRVSEIPNHAVTDFLLNQFLPSGHLTARELASVGR